MAYAAESVPVILSVLQCGGNLDTVCCPLQTALCLLRHARRRCSLPLPLLAGAVTPAVRGINFESVALHDVLQRRLLHCVSTHVFTSRKSR
jgi:hypothetical protein